MTRFGSDLFKFGLIFPTRKVIMLLQKIHRLCILSPHILFKLYSTVIMLTAKTEVEDKLVGFDVGADN
jgi:hypothetical protein